MLSHWYFTPLHSLLFSSFIITFVPETMQSTRWLLSLLVALPCYLSFLVYNSFLYFIDPGWYDSFFSWTYVTQPLARNWHNKKSMNFNWLSLSCCWVHNSFEMEVSQSPVPHWGVSESLGTSCDGKIFTCYQSKDGSEDSYVSSFPSIWFPVLTHILPRKPQLFDQVKVFDVLLYW